MATDDPHALIRLNALQSYRIVDTEAEPCFDQLVHLLAGICAAPMAALGFVDEEREWFKASVGLDLREVRRDQSFAATAIASGTLLVVQDASQAPEWARNPLVSGAPGVRFCAAMPLVSPEGAVLGALSVMDREPRTLSALQREALDTLSQQVVAQLQLRRTMFRLRDQQDAAGLPQANGERFRQLADAMPYIVWSARASGEIDYGNRTVIDYAGLNDLENIGAEWLKFLHPDDVAPTMAHWMSCVRSGETFSFEYRILRASDQTYRWHLAKGMPIRDTSGAIAKWYGTTMDIHDMKLAHEEIGRLAFYDPLTQLPNRQLLMDRLAHALATHARNGRVGAVVLIDLDKFKAINDTLGHAQGDVLLHEVAMRLAGTVRENDTVARLGGDEFVLVLEDLGTSKEMAAIAAERVARAIIDALGPAFQLAGSERHVTPSIGVALFDGGTDTHGELLKRADLAMYQAKASGRNTVCFFDPRIQTAAVARAEMEAELRQSLQAGQFEIHYQPQVDGNGQLIGVEALVRWQHPRRGMVSPAEFIPVAEDTGLILPLGRWILRTACVALAQVNAAFPERQLSMAVNVSALQFHQPGFVAEVTAALELAQAQPQQLKLELTESLLVDDIESAIDKMTSLRELGVLLSLDDFGTGYSSLSYLKRLPLHQLKIDRSFVRNVPHDARDTAIVNAIITLGHTMGMSVIAEGVETPEQRDFLAERGCRGYQGYLFSHPLPYPDLLRFLS